MGGMLGQPVDEMWAEHVTTPAYTTRAHARIKPGLQERLYLGNLDAQRDWGPRPRLRTCSG